MVLSSVPIILLLMRPLLTVRPMSRLVVAHLKHEDDDVFGDISDREATSHPILLFPVIVHRMVVRNMRTKCPEQEKLVFSHFQHMGHEV